MKIIINMKTQIQFLLSLSISLLLVVGIQAQTRQLDDFSKIRVTNGIKVELKNSNNTMAEIDMIRGDEKDLITEVKNGVLHVKFKSKFLSWGNNKNRARVTVHYRDLAGIDISSGSTLTAKETIIASDFMVDASSGSSLGIAIDANDLSVEVSSGTSVKISGQTIDLDVDASSGSSFNGSDLEADNVKVDSSSGSTAKVWAKKRISAEANSGSTITYKGNPQSKDIDSGKYSGGSVRAVN